MSGLDMVILYVIRVHRMQHGVEEYCTVLDGISGAEKGGGGPNRGCGRFHDASTICETRA